MTDKDIKKDMSNSKGAVRIGTALPIVFLIIGLIGGLLLYSSLRINEKEFRGSLLNEEIMDIMYNITVYHLKVEEELLEEKVTKGDKEAYIEWARKSVHLLLNGGISHDGEKVSPLVNPAHRSEAEALGQMIEELGEKVNLAFAPGANYSTDHEIHEAIDAISEGVIEKAEVLEMKFHGQIQANHTKSKRFLKVILALWLSFIFFAAAAVYFSEQGRRAAERAREKLIEELQDALANVKALSGLLPICAYCKNVRDDTGYWSKVESYISDHTDAEFTHGICDECAKAVLDESKKIMRLSKSVDEDKKILEELNRSK